MSKTPVSSIGKYQILELVGEGAMGTVYKAQDPVLSRSVAIKVMSDAIARDGALRDRFMREAQAAGSLQHPNVVTIFDFGEFEGHLYIAMEFVDGIDLEEMIERHVPMTTDQRLGIAIDVLLGLSYAHKHGVVHRDIKPANIRITEDGRAKIMDFGVAHLDSSKMTVTGMMVGTPNYMAPEQVTGQPIGPATDIFSLGAVLYELLAHRKAFGAESLHQVLFKVVSEDPPPLALIAPELPSMLDTVLKRALAKEPGERYQNAQEMANDLTAARARLTGDQRAASLSLSASINSHTAERKAQAAAARIRGGGKARQTTWTVAVSVGAAIVLVGATWVLATRRAGPRSGVDASIGPESTPPAVAAAVAPLDSGPTGGTTAREAPPAQPPAPKRPLATDRQVTTADAGREAAIVDVVRTSALQTRARAAAAGAPSSHLEVGDNDLAEADRLASAKRFAEAVAALNRASVSWGDAERQAARSVSVANSVPAPRSPPDSERAPVAPSVPAAPASVPALPTPSLPKVEPPTVAPADEIAALVAEYARAIEARDLPAIRALYPSITDQQQRGFRSFFNVVKSLRATLAPGSTTVDGATASARITGTYDYTNAAGKAERQAVSFNATFRRDGGRWRIASVR
jgi:serine/threonine-protein kinase